MIRVLGVKRVFVLVALLLLNAIFAASVYFYLMPEKDRKEREIRSMRAQISGLHSDIDRLQIEFDQLEEQQEQFSVLNDKGFFDSQDRRQAELIFKKIQKEAGVVSAVASIQAGEIEDNEEAKKAEHKILKSPISISIESVDDIDVFRYLYLVKNFFPGHLTVTSLNLERKADVSGIVLRSIANGRNPELVHADINMMWRTMIPESQIINKEEGQLR